MAVTYEEGATINSIRNSEYYNAEFIANLSAEYDGKIVIHRNGIIEAGIDGGNRALINTNLSPEETTLVVAGVGNGMNSSKYEVMMDRYNSDNPPNYSMTIPKSYSDSDNVGLKAVEIFSNSEGKCQLGKVLPVAYSRGGYFMIKNMSEILNNYDVPIGTFILNDIGGADGISSRTGEMNDTYFDAYSTLQKMGIQFVFNGEQTVDSDGTVNGVRATTKSQSLDLFASKGLTPLLLATSLRSGSDKHWEIFESSEKTGGLIDLFADPFYREVVEGTYKGKSFMYIDGEYIPIDSSELVDDSTDLINAPYEYLRNIDHLTIDYEKRFITINGPGGTIASNLDYIDVEMENIRSQIRASGFLNPASSLSVSSSIFGVIGGYIDQYFNMVAALVDSLEQETKSIHSYGQYFADVDEFFSKHFEKSNQSAVSTTKDTNEIENSEENYLTNNNNVSEENSSSTSSSKTYSEVTDINTSSYSSSSNNQSPKMFSIDLENGEQILIDHEGDSVTGMVYRFNYDSNEDAKNQYDIIHNEYNNKTAIDDIIIDSNHIDVVFKKETVANKSLNEIIKQYNGGNK